MHWLHGKRSTPATPPTCPAYSPTYGPPLTDRWASRYGHLSRCCSSRISALTLPHATRAVQFAPPRSRTAAKTVLHAPHPGYPKGYERLSQPGRERTSAANYNTLRGTIMARKSWDVHGTRWPGRMASKRMSLPRFRAPISTILLSSGIAAGARDTANSAAPGRQRGGGGMFEDLLAEVLAHAGARRGTLIGELLGMAPGLRLWQVRFGVGKLYDRPPMITERYPVPSSWDDDAATRSRHEPLGSTILRLSCLATDRETDGLSREPRRASARQ